MFQNELQVIQPGRVLLTAFGVAVVIKITSSSEETERVTSTSFKARLWRHVGKSVASSATAFLQDSCVIKVLPGAPGMISTERMPMANAGNGNQLKLAEGSNENENVNHPKIMIHCYSPAKDEYVVSYINDDIEGDKPTHLDLVSTLSKDSQDSFEEKKMADESPSASVSVQSDQKLFQLKASNVAPAKCAKFYPLIDDLITRGNDAAASAKSILEQNPKLAQLTERLSEDSSDGIMSHNEAISNRVDKATEVAEKVTDKIQNSIPDSEEVDGIYKMLKDEELTVLLSNGRDRLKHLLSENGLKESTQNALREMGVEISDENADGSAMMVQARQKALSALDELLENNLDINLESVTSTLGDKFGTMFDSLVTAAKSDGALDSILGEISSKTSDWQKQTGRLLSTRSSSLFMEGAQRIHARVGAILSPKQLALVERSGTDLTKAFTEGDIAVAQLKSIELGDSVRSRLFAAIEVRSETEGGLDSIIAGAISQVSGSGDCDSVGDLLAKIQNNATSSSSNAHESLISLLSERSLYHDISIQRIEKVFVDLDEHLGEDLTAERIVALARGEEGTAALFEPIANRAAKEIEKQLDTAEESIEDPTILNVITHVRKLMSGKLTFSNLVDEVVNLLDSDDAVKAGTSLAQTGENILDAIENASENKALSEVMGAVEKAGITKESVLDQIENLNVDDVLDTAGEAVTDEKKRLELLGTATDLALEFLLKILPSMPVPPFEGVRDGLIYSIKNLSMHGFKLKKEDIMVEIAGIRAAGKSGTKGDVSGSASFVQRDVKAADILVLDIRNVSAVFENALWSFEQTYMPHFKGNGRANIAISEGHIRLEFELKKRIRTNGENKIWEPVLCLNNRTCSIGQLSISFEGASRLAWIANKLAQMLKNPLRDYVVRILLDLLGNKSGWLLENLNGILSAHWDLILKTTNLNIDGLNEVNKNDIVAVIADPRANEIDLVWNEFVPLGINLLLNDKSGKVKVVDFPRGSQARKVAIDKEMEPACFKGATIAAINGSRCDNKDRVDLLLALRDPSRPKTIKFILAPEQKKVEAVPSRSQSVADTNTNTISVRNLEIVDENPIGLQFAKSSDNYLILKGFKEEERRQEAVARGVSIGDMLTHVNSVVMVGEDSGSIEQVLSCLETVGLGRPLSLGFMPAHLRTFTFKTKDEHGDPMIGGPSELILERKISETGSSQVLIQGYKNVDGSVESRGIFLGDHLIFVNGMPVGTGMKLRPDSRHYNLKQVVNEILNDDNSYPICLTFARPSSKSRNVEFDVESMETKNMSVVAVSRRQLGFEVGQGAQPNHFIVKKFHPVVGSLQLGIKNKFRGNFSIGLSLYSINGEKTPSYVSCDIVLNAIKRAWTKTDQLELALCNEEIKQTISTLK